MLSLFAKIHFSKLLSFEPKGQSCRHQQSKRGQSRNNESCQLRHDRERWFIMKVADSFFNTISSLTEQIDGKHNGSAQYPGKDDQQCRQHVLASSFSGTWAGEKDEPIKDHGQDNQDRNGTHEEVCHEPDTAKVVIVGPKVFQVKVNEQRKNEAAQEQSDWTQVTNMQVEAHLTN